MGVFKKIYVFDDYILVLNNYRVIKFRIKNKFLIVKISYKFVGKEEKL